MLAALEQGLIDLLNASALKPRLRTIDTLPDITPETVRNLAGTAPAIYVAFEDAPIDGYATKARLSLLCLARNARGHKAERQGDGNAIGLYEIVDSTVAILGNGESDYMPKRLTLDRAVAWRKLGIAAAVISVETNMTLPDALDLATLEPFVTFHNTQEIGGANTEPLVGELTLPQ